MSSHEEIQVPPTAQQSGSGAQNVGTASGSASPFRAPRNLPIPEKLVCQGDLTSNWEFFKQSWDDYEIATGLRNQESQVRLATLRSIKGREYLQILKNPGLSGEQSSSVADVLSALERYFSPPKECSF